MRAISYISCFVLAAAGAGAQGFVEDAFGVIPSGEFHTARADWAGLRIQNGINHEILPNKPEDVLIFLGPKSLVAGRQNGHSVALVFDAAGNLVADGIAARTWLGSGSTRPDDRSRTRNGIAQVRFDAAETAGFVAAGVTVGLLQSDRATYRVVSDLQQISPAPPVADEGAFALTIETMAEFATPSLTDAHGNPVEDGVFSRMVLISDNGQITWLPAVTLGGRANGRLLARDIVGSASMTVSLAGHDSPPTRISTNAARPLAPAEVRMMPLDQVGGTQLRVGPFVTQSGYLLNDGANVDVVITNARGVEEKTSGWVQNGYFTRTLMLAPDSGPFVVQLQTTLGREERLVSIGTTP